MNDKEYKELELRIEERNRIKAMVLDLDRSKAETMANRKLEDKRDKTSIQRAWGGGIAFSKRSKIAGDSFIATQIRNGD